ncbi:MAG: ribosome maturation factor RimM [Lachnospiraceae bacterium]
MEELLQVGVIANTHGIRGEVKVFPTTDNVKRFEELKKIWLDTGKGMKELEITQVKYFKNLAILKFKGIDNINEIEIYKGKGLFVTRKNAVKCEEDEYFIADLIGMQVITKDGVSLGVITDVLTTGANDVYVVDVHGKELLLPAIKECILKVDMDKRQIQVYVMPGLMD